MDFAPLLAFGAALFSGALAFHVWSHEKRSIVHQSFVAGMALLSAECVLNGLSANALSAAEMARFQNWGWLSTSFLPGIWLFFSLAYGRGNYGEYLKKWRLVLIAFFLLPAATGILFSGDWMAAMGKKRAVHWIFGLGSPPMIVNGFFLLGAIAVLMNLERTFRAAVGTMRWRIKFMILGLGVLFVVRLFTSSLALLFHGQEPAWQTLNCGALMVACALILRSLFRAGHFDLNIYPSHSVLQGSLTALLAGIYLVIIGVFANVATFGSGGAAFALKAFAILVALVFLALLLLSDRIRLHTSRFISRHFQRPMYDYRAVWRKFTASTALCVTQNELCNAHLKLLTDVFQCLSVTIWLVDDKHERLSFAASTFLSEDRATALLPKNYNLVDTIDSFQKHPEPADLDACPESWAAELRQCHPDQFDLGGHRICVPLTASGEFLGLTILGDRVAGLAFSCQDFDLLKCVGDQMAAGLLNARLSQHLMQTREFEAFQTMSAFFVHDLKNSATTLNLMLQNLPVHFDDPAFREDALRATAKSATHINCLVERLGHLRGELKIVPAETDLNAVVARALTGWESARGINLVKELRPLPKTLIDAEQLLKVVTNLVLNSREAVPDQGRVCVETSHRNGWAILSVSDNGCGMRPEFLNRSLFRPFQSTKKNGLGIGMFQSKMIVEAHRGRIEVESEPDKGTTFRILLPLHK